ncbi:MAG: nucleotidyltransferase [Nitrospira sp.]|jgi:predicted nucleotidyltransferase|nr:MAG: nucleotidyltransferase [Nitrospira sp.]
MNGKAQIVVPKERIEEFCRRHHVRKLSLFGSVLRDDFRSDSDVDVLVEFEPDHGPGFIALFQMEQELSRLLGGRKVDLITEKFLNRRIKGLVLATAEVQYAEG